MITFVRAPAGARACHGSPYSCPQCGRGKTVKSALCQKCANHNLKWARRLKRMKVKFHGKLQAQTPSP